MYVLQNIALVNLKSLQRILVYQTKYGVGKGLDKPWFILLLFLVFNATFITTGFVIADSFFFISKKK